MSFIRPSRAPRTVKRPLGVWLLTLADFFTFGVFATFLAARQSWAILMIYPPGDTDLCCVVIRNMQGLLITLLFFGCLWGLGICFAARGAWLGRNRARFWLVVL